MSGDDRDAFMWLRSVVGVPNSERGMPALRWAIDQACTTSGTVEAVRAFTVLRGYLLLAVVMLIVGAVEISVGQ